MRRPRADCPSPGGRPPSLEGHRGSLQKEGDVAAHCRSVAAGSVLAQQTPGLPTNWTESRALEHSVTEPWLSCSCPGGVSQASAWHQGGTRPSRWRRRRPPCVRARMLLLSLGAATRLAASLRGRRGQMPLRQHDRCFHVVPVVLRPRRPAQSQVLRAASSLSVARSVPTW